MLGQINEGNISPKSVAGKAIINGWTASIHLTAAFPIFTPKINLHLRLNFGKRCRAPQTLNELIPNLAFCKAHSVQKYTM